MLTPSCVLVQVILQLLGPAGVAQLAQRLRLNLPDPLTGDTKDVAHLFEGAGTAVIETEAEAEHLLLTGGEGLQHLFQLLLQERERGSLGRGCLFHAPEGA